tara:strand:+ start:170 stop:457 length:288 start_codon:yes stop_codon:yes gene_type:complete
MNCPDAGRKKSDRADETDLIKGDGQIKKKPPKPERFQGLIGEPDRIRTCGQLIKSQLLYQLSYGPSTLVKRVLMGEHALVNTCFPYFSSFSAFAP